MIYGCVLKWCYISILTIWVEKMMLFIDLHPPPYRITMYNMSWSIHIEVYYGLPIQMATEEIVGLHSNWWLRNMIPRFMIKFYDSITCLPRNTSRWFTNCTGNSPFSGWLLWVHVQHPNMFVQVSYLISCVWTWGVSCTHPKLLRIKENDDSQAELPYMFRY
jgi:hypothetical protein